MQIWNQNIHKRIIREPNASYAMRLPILRKISPVFKKHDFTIFVS